MTGASSVDRVSRDEIVALASRLISIPSTSGEERAVMEEVSTVAEGTIERGESDNLM